LDPSARGVSFLKKRAFLQIWLRWFNVDQSDFEGTLVLERFAELGKLDEFYEAIDSDDKQRVRTLMRKAGFNLEEIDCVLGEMDNTDRMDQ